MSSIRKLYARFRQLIHEGFKFLVIGAVGFIVTFGVANALHPVGKYKAITIATILATAVTYLGNRYWTFAHREGKGTTRDSTLFFVLNGVGLLIYYGCIGLIDLAGLGHSVAWYNVALVVGTGLGTLFRFWSYRKWIWRERPALAPGEPAEEEIHDLAAMVGAVPPSDHDASSWDAISRFPASGSANGAARNGASADGASADGASAYRPAGNGAAALRSPAASGASANGASAHWDGASANEASANGDGASANGASGDHAGASDAEGAPHSHARPGRPTFRAPANRQREPGSHTPASHRRTS